MEVSESERRFRSAFAQAAIGVAILDRQGAFVYANPALCRMTCHAEHELRQMHFSALLHPDDRESRLVEFDRILSGEIGSFVDERRWLRKDGSVLWVRTSVTVPMEPTGAPQIIAFLEDISERKQTEDALRASDERFRIAAENASDMIYEWDLGTDRMDAFGRAGQCLGDWPMPMTSDAWKSIVHPEDLPRILAQSARHIQNGERYDNEYRIVGQNGKAYHYSNRGQVIRTASGEPSRCIGLLTDITEIKAAEKAIAQLAAIVQCSEGAMFASNPEGAIITWNDGASGLLGYTADRARTLLLSDLFASPRLAGEILVRIREGHSSRMDDTLWVRADGSRVPVLLNVSPIRTSDGQIGGSAIIARDITASKLAEAEMAHRAMHDHLTDLPNRLLLADRLAESIAGANTDVSGAAVIFIDLDGFKLVNDTLGHDAGDTLLQQVAQRLSAAVRRGDLLGRMGGDEFMLIVNGVEENQMALAIAERLARALRDPFVIARHELVITASMGVAIYPRDGADVSALRRSADAAMYEAKQMGKGRVRFYRHALGAAVQARLEMETDLRHALDHGGLHLDYQPVFTASDKRLTAREALVRWPHPTHGLVPPNDFIPVAEETGLIHRLGEWVLGEACRQCRWWQDRGNEHVRVAVNVSALEFARPDFVGTVLGVLRETDLAGQLLDLELTESVGMNDIESTIHKMTELRGQGIRISMDDFGTGYSSLGYLPKLPIDILKIDRCFVRQIGENDDAVRLIQGMISLAHGIGKRVIVEGVETHAQLEILRDLGCDEVQGFLLGRPARLTRESVELSIA
jgi:diguanylate cyclase (GGDEF)-like protein/PAS domain S-box-containing protein